MGKQRLAGEAGGENVRVVLGIALPGSNHFQLEHPAAEAVGQHPVLEFFDVRQAVRPDVFEAPEVAGEGMDVAVDPMTAEVLEEVVVSMNAVEIRVRRVGLIEVPEQVVDKMRQRFGRVHSWSGQPLIVQ